MLGSLHGLGMLKNQSIEKRLNGLKKINMWARNFYAALSTVVKEEDYCRWLIDNQIINIILQDPTTSTLLKASTDILRLMFRKKCLGFEEMKKFFTFC